MTRLRSKRASKPAALTTTSFAILGLLAVKSGSAYELAKRMSRNYRFFWPRAESKLYEEAKRLVEVGYALATPGSTGTRPKTLYAITDSGLAALATWVGEAARSTSPMLIECEALVKITHADRASKAALLAHLHTLDDFATDLIELGRGIATMYAEGNVELLARAPMNLLVWRFLAEHHHALSRWARWAISEVEKWQGTRPTPSNIERARAAFRRSLKELPAPAHAPARH